MKDAWAAAMICLRRFPKNEYQKKGMTKAIIRQVEVRDV